MEPRVGGLRGGRNVYPLPLGLPPSNPHNHLCESRKEVAIAEPPHSADHERDVAPGTRKGATGGRADYSAQSTCPRCVIWMTRSGPPLNQDGEAAPGTREGTGAAYRVRAEPSSGSVRFSGAAAETGTKTPPSNALTPSGSRLYYPDRGIENHFRVAAPGTRGGQPRTTSSWPRTRHTVGVQISQAWREEPIEDDAGMNMPDLGLGVLRQHEHDYLDTAAKHLRSWPLWNRTRPTSPDVA